MFFEVYSHLLIQRDILLYEIAHHNINKLEFNRQQLNNGCHFGHLSLDHVTLKIQLRIHRRAK